MGLWTNVKNFLNPNESANNENHTSRVMPASGSLIGSSNTPYIGTAQEQLTTNEEIFSIVTRLANTVSSLPIHEYRDGKQINSGVLNLLRVEANMNTSSFQLINRAEVSKNVAGNGYIFIERNQYNGQPVALWNLDPYTVTIMRNIDDNSIWYRVSNDQYNFTVYNTEIIHVSHINPIGGFYGISPIDVLRNSLKFKKAIEDFSLDEMNKKDAYIIKYDRSVSAEKRQALINDFLKMVKDNGGAVVQEAGFKIERFESKFNTADLQAAEAISRTRIANAFNVPLSFLNDGQAKSTTNVEHVMTQFVEMTLLPIIKQYESEFNRKLLTSSQRARGFYFKFNVNGLMRGDTAARTQFYQMMIRNGVATQNELRKLEDLPPISDESANVLWISKDLFPSENQLKASNTETDNSQMKGGEESDEEDTNAKISNDQATSETTNGS